MTESEAPNSVTAGKNPFGLERPGSTQLKPETARDTTQVVGNEGSVDRTKKNPFGIEQTPPVEKTEQQQEITERVRALSERREKLMRGEIPVEQMTDPEKAAYFLANLKE